MGLVRVKVLIGCLAGDVRLRGGTHAVLGEATARDLERKGFLRILEAVSEDRTKVLNPPVNPRGASVRIAMEDEASGDEADEEAMPTHKGKRKKRGE